jgi:hypothetical protein
LRQGLFKFIWAGPELTILLPLLLEQLRLQAYTTMPGPSGTFSVSFSSGVHPVRRIWG